MSDGTKYTVKAIDGRVFEGKLGLDIRKTFDKRNRDNEFEQPQVVYECTTGNGVIVRVFADEVSEVNGVPV